MMAKKVVKGFYTDELKRIRPLTEYFGNGSQKLEERKEELKQKVEEKKDEPWMDKNPFTKEEVERYNYFSHFDVDINRTFNLQIEAIEHDIRERLKYYGIDAPTPEIRSALNAYRKALYEYYLEEMRAREAAPPWHIVGPSKYPTNRIPKAERIRENARERLASAKCNLEKAVNEAVKGKVPPSEKTKISLNQIDSKKLKKELGAASVLKNFHYKYKDGRGSFQYIVKTDNNKWYILAANHAPDGTLYDVKIGDYGYGGRLEHLDNVSYQDLIQKMKELMQN